MSAAAFWTTRTAFLQTASPTLVLPLQAADPPSGAGEDSPVPLSQLLLAQPQSTDLRIPCPALCAGVCSVPEKDARGPGALFPCPRYSHSVLRCHGAPSNGTLATGIHSPIPKFISPPAAVLLQPGLCFQLCANVSC